MEPARTGHGDIRLCLARDTQALHRVTRAVIALRTTLRSENTYCQDVWFVVSQLICSN